MHPTSSEKSKIIGARLVSRRAVSWAAVAAVTILRFGDFLGETRAVEFNREIRPILTDNCLACHGPDPGSRKAGLRLDTEAGLYEPTDKRGPAVTPGDLEKSELWHRVTTTDPDDLMPPADSNKVLDEAQKALLREWILEGAEWEPHWAFINPGRPDVPEVTSKDDAIRNPIDAFVVARLDEAGLEPNPEADRRTLARRLALDLTGLPPTPEQVEAFVNDSSPAYYERFVSELMNSPAWGEHRARYWLDAARYADTHGLHFDNYREMWPYRDWVINAFNSNMPFDQFTVEQIAGDLLESPTLDQLVATGFHRCNITTNEGGTIEEENLTIYAEDRVTTTGWVWMGLTTNCAACHDHKFDPITQKDFYSMAAFFRNTKQSGFDRNWREGDLYTIVPQSGEDRDRWDELKAEIPAAEETRDLRVKEAEAAFEGWLDLMAKSEDSVARLEKAPTFEDEDLRVAFNDKSGSRQAGKPFEVRRGEDGSWQGDGPFGPAPVFEAKDAINLGGDGAFEHGDSFSLAAWVYLPEKMEGEGTVIARMDTEENDHRGWSFYVKDGEFGFYMIHSWPKVALKVRSRDGELTTGSWHHIAMTYDGTSRADGVTLYCDGLEVKTSGDANRLEYSVVADVPLRIGRREEGNELKGVGLDDVRIYRRPLEVAELRSIAAGGRFREFLSEIAEPETPADDAELADEDKEKRDKELADAAKLRERKREVLRDYFAVTQFVPSRDAVEALASLRREHALIRSRSPITHIQQEKPDSKPVAHILSRGQYDRPGEEVPAAVPAFLNPMPEGAPSNRLGLAQWLVAPDNPLTARVTVNRFWQELFGTGLVKTTEDFGAVGEAPVNQELLDWLAVEFRESGWDVKHLFKLMVTSVTYRQGSEVTPEKLAKDPANRLNSRGPRFRMDAEMLRDYALASSGLLNSEIGGPSVRPYQPGGVWEAVAMPESNTRFYERESGEKLYRRSMYTFWKRAAPPASMDIFNAPARETCTVRRERTNTPLQALVTMNDPQFVEAARVLAARELDEAVGGIDETIDGIAGSVLLRPLSDEERGIIRKTYMAALEFYAEEPASAAELVSVGESVTKTGFSDSKLAATTVVANQIMNLDEVLNK